MPDFAQMINDVDFYIFIPGLVLAFILIALPFVGDVIMWGARVVRNFVLGVFDTIWGMIFRRN